MSGDMAYITRCSWSSLSESWLETNRSRISESGHSESWNTLVILVGSSVIWVLIRDVFCHFGNAMTIFENRWLAHTIAVGYLFHAVAKHGIIPKYFPSTVIDTWSNILYDLGDKNQPAGHACFQFFEFLSIIHWKQVWLSNSRQTRYSIICRRAYRPACNTWGFHYHQ